MKRYIALSLIIFLLLLNLSNAQYYSYNTVESSDGKYSLSLGIWNAKLSGDTYAPSANFTTDLENDLGFGNNKGFITFDFNYRLSSVNGIGFAFFSGNHKAVRNITRQITLPGEPNDVIFNANTNVFSEIKYSAFDIFYKRYFSTDQNYDFYGLLTVRFNNIKGDFVERDNSGNVVGSASFNVSAPTAYVGFGGNFNLSDNLKASYQVQGLSFSTGGDKVNSVEYQIGLGYNITPNWGINIGYRYNSTKGEDDLSRSLKLKYQGLVFGINGKF